MTVAELIRKLQSLDVGPDTPINFLVNVFHEADVDIIEADDYARVMPDGSWNARKEIDFHLHSDDLED